MTLMLTWWVDEETRTGVQRIREEFAAWRLRLDARIFWRVSAFVALHTPVDKADPRRWNPYTGRPMALEHCALALLFAFGYPDASYELAVRWAGPADEYRSGPGGGVTT
jgi:hypothetical protein